MLQIYTKKMGFVKDSLQHKKYMFRENINYKKTSNFSGFESICVPTIKQNLYKKDNFTIKL